MPDSIDFVFILEIIGTIAFAASGAMVAIQKDLDLLGIIVLGVTTAVGGGMIRDVILGIHPPVLFIKPVYVIVAILSIIILFLLVKFNHSTISLLHSPFYENALNLLDATGLGVFTVVGVNAARGTYGEYMFLKLFLGVITGVGGGILRDIMANETPAVLKKHVYACASIAGAVSYVFLSSLLSVDAAMIISIFLVVAIRLLARHYMWNLPHAL
ncbi:MAG: TRIC cation channel family protein [Eubacteriales bacterium]|nr:TRIC cation channel family protein [Eubacteriales bacterium]